MVEYCFCKVVLQNVNPLFEVCLFYNMLQMQHSYVIILIRKNQVLGEKKMRKILSLALLISLGMGNIGTVIAAEKTPVLNAGCRGS